MSDWRNVPRDPDPRSGSVVLNSWRAAHGPEATRPKAAQQYTLEELARLYDIPAPGSGIPAVSEASAMRTSAVYACVALIGGSIASLPLPVYQRTERGREAATHDYWWLLNESPHPEMSAAAFWEFIVTSMLLYGDGYARLLRRGTGVSGLMPLHPDRVRPFRSVDRGVLYEVTPEQGARYSLSPSDVLHFPTIGFDGLTSISPIRHAARGAISIALAADDYSAAFFANGARPDFALETEGALKQDQIETIRSTWVQRHGGANHSHLPAILHGGLKVKELTMKAEDSQLIETRGFQIEDIARIFGVPPFMIGHNEKTTSWGSGVEAMGIGFVKYTLQRHLVKIEQELNRKLWPSRERYFVEFNTAGLERGDYKTRVSGYRTALGRAGERPWMTVNEVRRLENLAPWEDGDDTSPIAGVAAPDDNREEDDEAATATARA